MRLTLQMTIRNLSNPSLLSIATIVHHKTSLTASDLRERTILSQYLADEDANIN